MPGTFILILADSISAAVRAQGARARVSAICSANSFAGAARRPKRRSQAEPGSSLEYQIEISFWEAVRGTVKKLTISRLDTCTECHGTGTVGQPQTCTACGGSGQVAQTSGKMRFNLTCTRCGGTGRIRNICRVCGGEGRVRRADTIEVRIPAGVQTGSRVRVPGRGNAGTAGEPPGDLYIITDVQPHPFFDRRGDDIYTTVPITVTEAALGAKIEVPTIDGRSLLRVPPGTNSGQKLRLREKGVPSVRTPRTARRPVCGIASDRAEAGGRARAGTPEGTGEDRAGRSAQGSFWRASEPKA